MDDARIKFLIETIREMIVQFLVENDDPGVWDRVIDELEGEIRPLRIYADKHYLRI